MSGTAETRWFIERAEVSDGLRPLEMRRYKARKQIAGGRLVSVARTYDVKGLYNLLRTPGVTPVWGDGEQQDVQAYAARVQARNRKIVREYK
jgi:hypothetical protein